MDKFWRSKSDTEIMQQMIEEESKLNVEYVDKALSEYELIIEPIIEEEKPHKFIPIDKKHVEDKPPEDWKPKIQEAPYKVCEEKFNNFKNVCKGIDASNEWIIYFCENVDLRLFLFTVRSKLLVRPNITIDEIYADILKTSTLTDEKVGPGVKDKVKRYIDYFLQIAKVI